MIQSNLSRKGEQLKLNMNAIVDKINLINVTHKPEPICIDKKFTKTNNYSNTNPDRNVCVKSSFEYIDEEKLLMYSFLAKRDLKTKEWLTSQPVSDTTQEQRQPVRLVKKIENAKKPSAIHIATSSIQKSLDSNLVTDVEVLKPFQNNSNIKCEGNDVKKCCDESIRSIEHLLHQLNTYKCERLKIVCNDPQEEEKQKRIQLEQIKYLSRSMYNHQNQLSRFKVLLSKDQQKKNQANPVLKRIIHTMGLVVKTVQVFADLYPYRPDMGEITEKLYAHFFKQLQCSMQNFSQCISHLDESQLLINKLKDLLDECGQNFVPSSEMPIKQTVKVSKDLSKFKTNIPKAKQIVKVVHGQRSMDGKKSLIKKKPELSGDKKARLMILRQNVQRVFKKNAEKTKMYPSRENSKTRNCRSSSSEEKIPTILYPRPGFKYLSQDIENSLNLSVNSIHSPEFKHMSSETLSSIQKKNTNFRSQSAEKLSEHRSRSADRFGKNQEIKSYLKKPETMEIYDTRPILHSVLRSRTFSPDKRSISPFKQNRSFYSSNSILTRLDTIKKESDQIRKKYEKLNYADSLINPIENSNQKRPYEECYLDDDAVIVTNDFVPELSCENSFLKLNSPTEYQLRRVLEYANKFAEYSKKSSVTEIGETEFDDFQLFEYLSENMHEELFSSVYEELEEINEDLTKNLVDNEFMTQSPYTLGHQSVSANNTVLE